MPSTNYLHTDVLDFGLTQISTPANWQGGTLTQVICKGKPATRAEALTLYPAGKRVSAELVLAASDVPLGDRAGGGREIATAAKPTAQAAVSTAPGDDLYCAWYDGTRLLVALDEPSNKGLNAGDTFTIPSMKIGFGATP